MKNSKKRIISMKSLLIIQSFFPLAILLLIKYGDIKVVKLSMKFAEVFIQNPANAITKALVHAEIFLVLLHLFCITITISGVFIYVLFKKIQGYGFVDRAEKILIEEDTTETSVGFFVTYITPMLMDEINQARGFGCFAIIFLTLVLLMRNTNLYYQNPILVIMGYRTFKFSFKETTDMTVIDKSLVAITRGDFDENKIIQRKKVDDNVFVIYNKH